MARGDAGHAPVGDATRRTRDRCRDLRPCVCTIGGVLEGDPTAAGAVGHDEQATCHTSVGAQGPAVRQSDREQRSDIVVAIARRGHSRGRLAASVAVLVLELDRVSVFTSGRVPVDPAQCPGGKLCHRSRVAAHDVDGTVSGGGLLPR